MVLSLVTSLLARPRRPLTTSDNRMHHESAAPLHHYLTRTLYKALSDQLFVFDVLFAQVFSAMFYRSWYTVSSIMMVISYILACLYVSQTKEI
jgi:hypothetical protein